MKYMYMYLILSVLAAQSINTNGENIQWPEKLEEHLIQELAVNTDIDINPTYDSSSYCHPSRNVFDRTANHHRKYIPTPVQLTWHHTDACADACAEYIQISYH